MDDDAILRLFESRDEAAIAATQAKYDKLCTEVARRILHDPQDTEECVSDVMLLTWNAIPPAHPRSFPAFLTVLTRNAALSAYRHLHRVKRGGGEIPLVLDELEDVIPAHDDTESLLDRRLLRETLETFLDEQDAEARQLFVLRYITMMPVKEIAARSGMTESKVKVTLYRTRKKLHRCLKKEGFL